MENQINRLNEIAPLYEEFFMIEEPQTSLPKETEKKAKTLSFLGSNKKSFLLLYSVKSGLTKEDQEMVHNLIVNAIRISWDDVVFLNTAENEGISFSMLVETFKPKHILAWGCHELTEGIQAEKYDVKQLPEYRYLLAEPIAKYHGDQEEKKKLWGSIRQLLELP